MSLRRVLPALLILGVVAGGLAIVQTCRAQDEAVTWQNVELLTHVKSKSQMRSLMKEQAKALGVKCTYCHVKGKFGLDDKKEKVEAREMMRMVNEINAKYFADEEQGITCWTCHQGNDHPELTRPPGEQTAPEGFQAAEPAGN